MVLCGICNNIILEFFINLSFAFWVLIFSVTRTWPVYSTFLINVLFVCHNYCALKKIINSKSQKKRKKIHTCKMNHCIWRNLLISCLHHINSTFEWIRGSPHQEVYQDCTLSRNNVVESMFWMKQENPTSGSVAESLCVFVEWMPMHYFQWKLTLYFSFHQNLEYI